MKDKFAFFEAYKNPDVKEEKTACKTPIFIGKRALFETPFKLDRVGFSTPDVCLRNRNSLAGLYFKAISGRGYWGFLR